MPGSAFNFNFNNVSLDDLGRLLAIMGPSGSGKTTLLNSISGNLVQAKGLCLEGCLLVNGELSKNGVSGVNHAYVKQDDIFYTQMTVKETLDFHAKLRVSRVDISDVPPKLCDNLQLTRPRPCMLLFEQLPRTMPAMEKDAMVESIMGKLALTKASNTIVGGGKVRGISGGERKRLSVGCPSLQRKFTISHVLVHIADALHKKSGNL